MHKHFSSYVTFGFGAAVVGAALLMSGCGGTSVEKSSFGTYQNAVPATYGIEGTAANGNISSPLGGPFFYETSGLGSADSSKAYQAAAIDFSIVKNPNNATLLSGVDPNGTGKVPLGFSGTVGSDTGSGGTVGQYIDANSAPTPSVPTAVTPGTSVVFRAAISNGLSSTARSPITINPSGVSLTSADPEWTLGVLPLTFNYIKTGPFANATYVTGTPVTTGQGTPTPFTVPFTTTGIHTVVLTVSDDAGQQTATTFAIPVVTSADVALVLQNFITVAPTKATPKGTATPITAGDTVTLDGGAGIGSYPAGFASTTADAQGTVVFFTTPGTHTVTETDPKGAVVQTSTFTLDAAAAGTTVLDVPTTTNPAATTTAPKARRH